MDLDDKGYVGENVFRNLMKGKPGITPEDVEEMITEYKGFEKTTEVVQDKEEAEAVIYYKGKINIVILIQYFFCIFLTDFVAMLQS